MRGGRLAHPMGGNGLVLLKEDGTPYKTAVLIPTINNADELDIVPSVWANKLTCTLS